MKAEDSQYRFHMPFPRGKCCNSDSRSPKGRSLPARPQAQGRQADGRRRRRRGRPACPAHENTGTFSGLQLYEYCAALCPRDTLVAMRACRLHSQCSPLHTQSMTGFIKYDFSCMLIFRIIFHSQFRTRVILTKAPARKSGAGLLQ